MFRDPRPGHDRHGAPERLGHARAEAHASGGEDTERWILHLGEQRAGVALPLDDAAQRGGDQARRQDARPTWYSSGWNRWWLVRSTTVTSTSAPSSPRVTLSPPNPPAHHHDTVLPGHCHRPSASVAT